MIKEINCAIVCGYCGVRLEGWNYDGVLWLYDNHYCPSKPPKLESKKQ